MDVSGKTKIYGIIGHPVEHSLSPAMQNVAFKKLKLDCIYLAFNVEPNNIKTAVNGMKSLGICGFNVTIPHKISIIPFLDEVRPEAADIGAVNTVLNENGKLIGFNTDGLGALRALKEENVDLLGKKVIILGAGGAARAIAFAIAPFIEKMVILNRTGSKAKKLSTQLAKRFGKAVEGKKFTKKVANREFNDADIVINATSVGMYPNVNDSLINREMINPAMTVFDVVYNPLETKLLKEANAVGAKIVTGIKMLVFQGAVSFEIWTGKKAPVKEMLQTVIEKLRSGSQ
jgi:shikimate dehydrogenase